MSIAASTSSLQAFQWKPQPKAQQIVAGLFDEMLRRCPAAQRLRDRLYSEAGVRLFDLVDHMTAPDSDELRRQLAGAGFTSGDGRIHRNEEGIFPAILLADRSNPPRLAIKVESVADFLSVWRQPESRILDLRPLAPLRRAVVAGAPFPAAAATEEGWHGHVPMPVGTTTGKSNCPCHPCHPFDAVEMVAIERHGHRDFDPPTFDDAAAIRILCHAEALRARRRDFGDDADGFAHLDRLIDSAIADLGPDRAADLFFASERDYWQRRNRAAQVQKARQDRLGIGWANHDHLTYRSSRSSFPRLVAVFEKLGLRCRERFYAGAEAGWGAQVMEQPNAGIVVFADVDLSPDELAGDFAHEPLPQRETLGTVGLWCALHGESLLQAGMHHLECQFSFDALREQLAANGVGMMTPFTDYPFLHQAFTEGERWQVNEDRLRHLLDRHQITAAQAEQFLRQGAIGSHLENLERNDGFKGFNQKGVSDIIARTDPRGNF